MYENILPEDYQAWLGETQGLLQNKTEGLSMQRPILPGGNACPETVGLQPNGSSTFTAPAGRTGNIDNPESLCSASIGAALS